MLSRRAALIYAMVVAAGRERGVRQEDVDAIATLVEHLPIFDGIDSRRVGVLAARCSDRLSEPGGRQRIYREIRRALCAREREAAYALSCDVMALCRPRPDRAALGRIGMQLGLDPAMAQVLGRAALVRAMPGGAPEGVALADADKVTAAC